MRFAKSAFGLGAPVTPVAIRLSTALPLETDTIWSPLGVNVLWTLFQPYHAFELTVITPSVPSARTDEGSAHVASVVARRIAAELGIEATEWATADKAARAAEAKQVGKARWLARLRSRSSSSARRVQ